MDGFNLGQTLIQAGRARIGGPKEQAALAEQLGLSYLARLPRIKLEADLAKGLDVAWMRKNRMVPIATEKNLVRVAIADPLAVEATDELGFVLGRPIEVVVAPEDQIMQALNAVFSESLDSDEDFITQMEVESGIMAADLEALPDIIDSDEAAPVIKLVNRMLFQAVNEQASDVHIEPGRSAVKVRFRIDGILYDRFSPPRSYMPYLASRIKVMSGLNIAERRLPQDGRFQFKVAERAIDVRVSVIPTSEGERLVLRLLDKGSSLFSLEDLGLGEDNLTGLARMITRPHGIILVTGPTGSGKTTTLYAALARLNSRELNIITIEDPVEYHLPGVGQIHVRSKIGLTFASGLRSILRHDPDVIMIGEIRDLETAEIAIQAALTGHLVFSTLHTNDAPAAVTRLVDMGIEPFLVSSTVIGVEAQRLLRVLCPSCKQPHEPSAEALLRAGLEPQALADCTVFRATGCPDCFNTGYRGRTGIYELLEVNETIQETLIQTPEANVVRRAALSMGMRPLVADGLSKVRRGVTSLEEVLRVTAG